MATAAADSADSAVIAPLGDAGSGPDAVDANASVDAAQGDVGSGCPKAVVSVAEGFSVAPQTTLHLSGSKSVTADGGPPAKFLWTVKLLKQPPGSKQAFAPSGIFPNPTFTVYLAGTYEFCLTVWDAKGKQSCQSTCTKVVVVPDAALHIELTWDTPGNPNPTNTGPAAGADLDLHFAHDLAASADLDCDGQPDPWFSNPFDTFWFNPNPNWGQVNPSTNENPSLDLEATDNSRPELLNLAQPEGALASPKSYAVGVHYWDDNGFGPSQPTIRVYVLGALAVTLTGPQMNALDFWYVGKVQWPNSMSDPGASLTPVALCFQTGSPCEKVNPGKMWTSSGDHCVRPCYVNPAFTATQPGASAGGCSFP